MYQGADRAGGGYIGGGELWSDDVYLGRKKIIGQFGCCLLMTLMTLFGIATWIGVMAWLGLVV